MKLESLLKRFGAFVLAAGMAGCVSISGEEGRGRTIATYSITRISREPLRPPTLVDKLIEIAQRTDNGQDTSLQAVANNVVRVGRQFNVRFQSTIPERVERTINNYFSDSGIMIKLYTSPLNNGSEEVVFDVYRICERDFISMERRRFPVTYVKNLSYPGVEGLCSGQRIIMDTGSIENSARSIYAARNQSQRQIGRMADRRMDDLSDEERVLVGHAITNRVYSVQLRSLSEDQFVRFYMGNKTSGQHAVTRFHEGTHAAYEDSFDRSEIRAVIRPYTMNLVDPRLAAAQVLQYAGRREYSFDEAIHRQVLPKYIRHVGSTVNDFLNLTPERALEINNRVYSELFPVRRAGQRRS